MAGKAAGHTAATVRKQREMNSVPAHSPHSTQCGALAHEMLLARLKVGLLTAVSPVSKFLHAHAQRFILQLILDQFKMAALATTHRFFDTCSNDFPNASFSSGLTLCLSLTWYIPSSWDIPWITFPFLQGTKNTAGTIR